MHHHVSALQVLRQEIVKSGEQNIQQPVNLKRLLWNAQRVFDKEQGGKAQSSKLSQLPRHNSMSLSPAVANSLNATNDPCY